MEKIRLIIIEDNKLLREGIRLMIKNQKDIMVVAALGDRINVQDKIRDLIPDILLMDLGLIHQNSLELVKSLKKKFPKLKIIVMDLLPVQSDMIQFLEAGISGFILKDATTEEFMTTIRSVAKGDKIILPHLNESLLSEIVDKSIKEFMNSKLIESIRMTENEKIITEYVSEGFTDKEIGSKLRLNASLVKGHIDNILEKLSLSKHVQIAVYRDSGGDSFNSSDVRQMKTKILKKDKTNGSFQRKQIFSKIK